VVDVLEFPSQEKRAFAFLERSLRALLSAKGADEQLIVFALDALTSVYGELAEQSDCSFSVDLPANIKSEHAQRLQQQIAEGVDAIRRQHHDHVVRLAARLVLTELQLFQQQRSNSPDVHGK